MDVLSGTHTSKRTRNYWRVSNTLQFKLPPRLGPVTILPSLESRHQYHQLLYTFKFLNGLSFCPPGFFTIESNKENNILRLLSKEVIVDSISLGKEFQSLVELTKKKGVRKGYGFGEGL